MNSIFLFQIFNLTMISSIYKKKFVLTLFQKKKAINLSESLQKTRMVAKLVNNLFRYSPYLKVFEENLFLCLISKLITL